MSALPAFKFDPLESFDDLKSSGVEERQARAFIKLVKGSSQTSLENLASKEDLLNVKSELKQDIVLSEARLDNKITEVKSELKQDILEAKSELKQDISEMKGSLTLLTRMFFATFVIIAVGLVTALFHH